MYKYKIYSVLVIILKIGVNYSILIIKGDDLMNIQILEGEWYKTR